VADSAWRLGNFLLKTDRTDEAEKILRKALEAMEQAVADAPTQANFRRRLAQLYVTVGRLMQKAGRRDDAEKAYQRAIETWEHLLEDYPDVAINHHELARFLAKPPATGLRNLERATKLATRGTELAPDDSASWYTLGAVQYAAGRWDEARVALEKAVKIGPEGSVSACFLLSRTQWQLGDRVAARRSYGQAVEWMEKDSPDDKDLQRLRAKAAALLGIKAAPAVAAAGQDEPPMQKMP
jgi:tetratricopeptide (TPR) repeat protein